MTLKFPTELIINGDEWKIQPFRFNVHAINTGSYTPSYRDVTVTGVSPLNLPNAQANGLKTIKLFGKCEQSPNLFDRNKATLNYYINSSGNEQYNTSWSCSDYIEVTVGKPYNFSGVSSYGSSPRTGFYAADKSFVSARSQSSADFTIPDGVKYIRVSIYKASIDTAVVKQVLSMDNPIPILCNNGEVGSTVRLLETVRIFGKNLFDQSQLLNATDWSLNSDGYYNGLFSNFNAEFTNGFEIDVPFKEKTVYTLSCKGYVSDEGARARFIFVYTDETSKSLTIDGTSPAEYTLTTSSTKTLAKIRGSYASGASSTLYLKDIQLEEGSSATTFQPYHASPTAVARDLLSCGDDYVDEQNITTGEITRKVGVHIFDGTENWRKSASQPSSGIRFQANTGLANRAYGANLLGLCTHFNTVASSAIQQDINTFVYSTFNEYIFVIVDSNNFPTVDDWTSYVANLYAQGKPIIITYPLATSMTETVAAQNTLQNVEGLNTLYITQSAIDGLSMEVTYSAGVEVTIQAVQNANVDQQVEVTIGG